MEPRKYHNIRLSRAWNETWKFVKEKKIYEIPFIIIATIAHIVVSKKYYDILIALGYETVGLLIMFLLLFLWKSLRVVPKRIYKEQQGIIDSQQKTIESLEGQQRHKLEVNFKQGEHPWVKEQSGTLPNGKDYIFSIELMNSGPGNINNPKVRLFIKSSEDDNFKKQWNLQVNSKDIPKTDEEEEGEFVGVLKYFRRTENKSGNDALWMIGSVKEKNNEKARIPIQKYDIKIRASSDNGGEPVIKRFRFIPRRKHPEASMEMIDPLLDEKALELEKWINKSITIEPDLSHNPNAIVKYTYESKLLKINNFCATYRLENGEPYSKPLEKILLSKDNEHDERLKLIIMP